jgi:hypothetical protein
MIRASAINIGQVERYAKAEVLVAQNDTQAIANLYSNINPKKISVANKKRLARALSKMRNSEPYTEGSLFYGAEC